MTVSRLNFTGRKTLHRKHMQFFTYSYPDNRILFDAVLDFSAYDLPLNSSVIIEAYRQTTLKRFEPGNLHSVQISYEDDISDFVRAEGVKFRVKVVSDEEQGLLLAQADAISSIVRESEDSTSSSLLKVRQSSDLGQEVYRLQFENEPVLLVNSDLGNYQELVLSKQFTSLVFTSVFRQILIHVLIIVKYDDTDSDDWEAKWLRYAVSLTGMEIPEDTDEDTRMRWIEEAVSSFARKFALAKLYKSIIGD